LQERVGLDVSSDGEWRRVHYLDEFLLRVGGHQRARRFKHNEDVKFTLVVTGKMQRCDPLFVDDAEFLVKHTDRCTKFALPSPFLIAIRLWHEDYSTDAYPTMEHYMEHLTELLALEAQALAQTGINIIQLDDPAVTYLCDRKLTGEGITQDDRLKHEWDIDRVNLEFAYQGTGESDDLALLPEGIGVGMGVVDVRIENIQTVEEIETIGAAGAAIIDPSRIGLNPDCSFAPDYGEPPSIDEAYEKLCNLTRAASRLRERFAI
jgi:methionine synthase II (cobalamin-independent)